MIERARILDAVALFVLVLGAAAVCFPLYYALVAASLPEGAQSTARGILLGGALLENVERAFATSNLSRQLWNSLVVAIGITTGKIVISIVSAYALTFFSFRGRSAVFFLVFLTLLLPVEVRIVPTYEIASNLLKPVSDLAALLGLVEAGQTVVPKINILDSYTGLILPLIASATATFLFRQFFLTVPRELSEAARIDGAGPIRFFLDILLPLSKTPIAAMAVILFVFGWNQYLWPLLITTEESMVTVVMGVARTLPTDDPNLPWSMAMTRTLIAIVPPLLVIVVLQRWFVRGLLQGDR